MIQSENLIRILVLIQSKSLQLKGSLLRSFDLKLAGGGFWYRVTDQQIVQCSRDTVSRLAGILCTKIVCREDVAELLDKDNKTILKQAW